MKILQSVPSKRSPSIGITINVLLVFVLSLFSVPAMIFSTGIALAESLDAGLISLSTQIATGMESNSRQRIAV